MSAKVIVGGVGAAGAAVLGVGMSPEVAHANAHQAPVYDCIGDGKEVSVSFVDVTKPYAFMAQVAVDGAVVAEATRPQLDSGHYTLSGHVDESMVSLEIPADVVVLSMYDHNGNGEPDDYQNVVHYSHLFEVCPIGTTTTEPVETTTTTTTAPPTTTSSTTTTSTSTSTSSTSSTSTTSTSTTSQPPEESTPTTTDKTVTTSTLPFTGPESAGKITKWASIALVAGAILLAVSRRRTAI